MQEVYRRRGFKTERLHVVHLGIDIDQFKPNTCRAELGNPVRLMFAGHLWEGKGPQVAIRALADLKKQAPSTAFMLDIYGKGKPEFQNYLEQLAVELDVGDAVRFCGFASQDELGQAFHLHDIFLFTSIWGEPFSITLLQAMSSGIPVIATSAGGNPEAIEPERTGLLVPPNDPPALSQATLRLVQDAKLRNKLGREAGAAVRATWSFSRYVDTLETLYETFASRRKSNAER
jgi:glycosyltransferase involved in cell wall biosynthesis